jgi:hypothetical protein
MNRPQTLHTSFLDVAQVCVLSLAITAAASWLSPLCAQGATTPSRFWTNLVNGLPQTLAICGSSMSDTQYSGWPKYLQNVLSLRFGSAAHVVHLANVGWSSSTVIMDPKIISKILATNPDAVTIESAFDAPDICDSTYVCVRKNWISIVNQLRGAKPGIEIFWYIVNPHCSVGTTYAPDFMYLGAIYEQQRDFCRLFGIPMVDTWWAFLDSFQTNSNYESQGDCGVNLKFVPDSHHPSSLAGSDIIVPMFISTMSGAPVNWTPPSTRFSQLSYAMLSPSIASVSFAANQPAVDTGSAPIGYSLWVQADTDCTPRWYNISRGKTFRMASGPLSLHQLIDSMWSCGSQYWVTAFNEFGRQGAPSETLSVTKDLQPPQIVGIRCASSDSVLVDFQEPITSASAQNPASYHIDQGVNVLSASLSGVHSVLLQTSSLQECLLYSLSIPGVRDNSDNKPDSLYIRHFIRATSSLPICLLQPRPKDTYRIASRLPVQWISADSSRSLTLALSTDGGLTFGNISLQEVPEQACQFSWDIPAVFNGDSTSGDQTYIRLTDYSTKQYLIAGPFSIVESNLKTWKVAALANTGMMRRAWTVRFSKMSADIDAAKVEIVDFCGRSVWEKGFEPSQSAENLVQWPGTNSRGVPAAAGLYFMRLMGHSRGGDWSQLYEQRAVFLR